MAYSMFMLGCEIIKLHKKQFNMTKQHPILFSSSMVRAILSGQKSQTRRIVTDKHLKDLQLDKRPQSNLQMSPYGKMGESLWVKEEWRVSKKYDDLKPRDIPMDIIIEYRAESIVHKIDFGKWRSPLFMCRHFSRILLEITEVRIEYLNDCSQEDAQSEGVVDITINHQISFRELYKNTWESLHWKGSWETNPLVWVISFEIQKS